MTDLPVPKYKIGDTVWRGRVIQKELQLPCPDCLDARKWKIVTPGGSELEADCQRCRGGWTQRGVPSLKDYTYEAVVDKLTIGSVSVDTSRIWDDEDQVQYMCRETGIASGSVYNERTLHPAEEAARVDAEVDAAAKEAKRASAPERLGKVSSQHLQLKDAALDAANSAIWNSWYRYQCLREDVEGEIEGDNKATGLDELRENLRTHLDWDKEHRGSVNDVFEAILKVAKTAAARWCDIPLREALERLPSLQEERRKAKAEELVQRAVGVGAVVRAGPPERAL